MPWVFKKERPEWHSHPLKIPKKVRAALAPLVMVTRKQWGALPANDEDPMEVPVDFVRLVQTWTKPCDTREDCVKLVQDLQIVHMREGMPDINWNFLVGGDGRVYETRGWKMGATRDFDNYQSVEAQCLDIAYIGNYQQFGEDIPEIMKKQVDSLIAYGLENEHIHCCYTMIPFNTEKDIGYNL